MVELHDERDAIAAAIDTRELVDLALTLGNMPSRSGEEAAWRRSSRLDGGEGVRPRRVGATPERPNIIGEYGGNGRGANLLFTAHLDTESPSALPEQNAFRYRESTLADPEWTKCWIEDGRIRGYPVSNDRGPMSCFLIAAKALKKAGIGLAGKTWLTACPGEIGPEPIEEFSGIAYNGKDIGAHYLFPSWRRGARLRHRGGGHRLWSHLAAAAVTRCSASVSLDEALFTPILDAPREVHAHPNPIYTDGAGHRGAACLEPVFRGAQHSGNARRALCSAQIASVRAGMPFDYGAGTESVRSTSSAAEPSAKGC